MSNAQRRRRQRRRRIAIGIGVVLLLLLGFGALVGYRMMTLNRDLRLAHRSMVQAGRLVEQGEIAEGHARLKVASRAV